MWDISSSEARLFPRSTARCDRVCCQYEQSCRLVNERPQPLSKTIGDAMARADDTPVAQCVSRYYAHQRR